MTIRIYTNLVYGGWAAHQLDTGIGGSEEKLIELARELAKEHDVTIYMNGEHGNFDKVKYCDHREFQPLEFSDVFISFKAAYILNNTINADIKLHWTTEVEGVWPKHLLDEVDRIICISKYHQSRMPFNHDKLQYSYLWADTKRLDKNQVPKEDGTVLYSSSFDRGLEELLTYWDVTKDKLGVNKLLITYGWDFMLNMMKNNPKLFSWKTRIEKMMERGDIEFLGRLSNDDMCKTYWLSQYWALPLNNPDSELFCINAIKAQYCGAIPIVRKIGALQETVNEAVNWDWIIGRPNHINSITELSGKNNKDHALKFTLEASVKEWNESILSNF